MPKLEVELEAGETIASGKGMVVSEVAAVKEVSSGLPRSKRMRLLFNGIPQLCFNYFASP